MSKDRVRNPLPPFISCACGCGLVLHSMDRKRRRPKWIVGHCLQRGALNPFFKGGCWINVGGYIVVRDSLGREKYEHRLVLERKLGRPLAEDEECDHINQVKTDNRPENLRVLTKSEHRRRHSTKDLSGRVCSDCGSSRTQLRYGKYITWFKSKEEIGKFVCRNCYERQRYAHRTMS